MVQSWIQSSRSNDPSPPRREQIVGQSVVVDGTRPVVSAQAFPPHARQVQRTVRRFATVGRVEERNQALVELPGSFPGLGGGLPGRFDTKLCSDDFRRWEGGVFALVSISAHGVVVVGARARIQARSRPSECLRRKSSRVHVAMFRQRRCTQCEGAFAQT